MRKMRKSCAGQHIFPRGRIAGAQAERKARLFFRGFDRDFRMMLAHDQLADRKPQPRAAAGRVRLVRLVEALEQVREILRRNHRAVVFDRQAHVAADALRLKRERSALRQELDRVVHQIRDHLADSICIAAHEARVRQQIESDLKTLVDCLCTIARGGEPPLSIEPVSLADYAPRMAAPHRMDLMVSSMVKDGAWHCNQKCLHCYAANQPLSAVPELDTDQWLAVIEKCRNAGIPQLTFTGGEPTLRHDLVKLVQAAQWFVTRLNTNGRMLTSMMCKDLPAASLDAVQITFYSADADIHNALVGVDGYTDTLNGIKNALAADLNVSLNTPLCSLNRDYLSVVRFAHELGVRYLTCSGLIPAGNAESDASRILQGLGLGTELHYNDMATLDPRLKVKVLLAQALFGSPDLLMMDEPTNNLDIDAVNWLEDFLLDFEGTVIVVSHDRHFLNTICTHIVDIDYNKIKMYVGNYDFWYDASQLMQNLMKNQSKKNEEKAQELKEFISRFSANKSKSKQATARRKLLDKLTVEEMPASSRRYPWVAFSPDREVGKDILFVTDVSKTIDGVKVLDKVSFIVGHGDKIAFVGDNENAHTALFKILTGEMEPDEGTVKWGQTATFSYFPKDNTPYFQDNDDNLVEWLREFSPDPHESYLRGFLGRMLFSGDDVYKSVKVLSGGEKVRCMLSRMMMFGSNVLILDQPTNHLDLESITAVNNGLTAFKGIVLFASYDHEFVETVANRIMEFTPDGLIDRLSTYDEYLEWKQQNRK